MDSKAENNTVSPRGNRDFGWRTVLLILGFVLAAWVLSYVTIWTYFGKLEVASQFGDMFGAINALFSGLALAGVVFAILLQRRELELQRGELRLTRRELQLQREELKLTRNELARTADAQEKSEKILALQAQALEQTARLSALQLLPVFGLKIHLGSDKSSHIYIENIGLTHAYDVDLRVLGVYSDQIITARDFIRQNVTRSDSRLRNFENAVGDFSVSDRLYEFSLPVENHLSGKPIVIHPIHRLLILLQYRDASGNNYCQLYTFHPNYRTDDLKYDLWQIDPIAPKIYPRLDDRLPDLEVPYTGDDQDSPYLEADLVTEDGSPVPKHLQEFAYLWEHSLPASYVTVPYSINEPRVIVQRSVRRR